MTGLIFSPPELNTLRYLTSWPSYRLTDSFLRRPGFSKTRPIWALFPFSSDSVLPAPVDLSLWRLCRDCLDGLGHCRPLRPVVFLPQVSTTRCCDAWWVVDRQAHGVDARPSRLSPLLGGGQGPAPPRVCARWWLLPSFQSNHPTASLSFFIFDDGKQAWQMRSTLWSPFGR